MDLNKKKGTEFAEIISWWRKENECLSQREKFASLSAKPISAEIFFGEHFFGEKYRTEVSGGTFFAGIVLRWRNV